jgi:hypothetical protein
MVPMTRFGSSGATCQAMMDQEALSLPPVGSPLGVPHVIRPGTEPDPDGWPPPLDVPPGLLAPAERGVDVGARVKVGVTLGVAVGLGVMLGNGV